MERKDGESGARGSSPTRRTTSARRNTYIALLTTLAAVLAISLSAMGWAALLQARRAEADEGLHTMQRALYGIQTEFDALKAKAADWAAWDDAYRFVRDRNAAFENSNLPPEVLGQLDLDVLMFVDTSGNVVWVDAGPATRGGRGGVPPTLMEQLRAGGMIGTPASLTTPKRGVVMLGDLPLLVVTAPITTSHGEGPARGEVLFGRAVGPGVLSRFSRLAETAITVTPSGSMSASADVAAAGKQLTAAAPVLTDVAPNLSTSGHALVSDIVGRPAFILSATIPRNEADDPLLVVGTLAALVFVVGVGGAIVSISLVERTSLSRISWLQESLARIGDSGGLEARIELPPRGPHDEVWGVAVEVNRTLETLEGAQRAYDEKQQFFAKASHELRTPLNSIIGFSTLLATGVPGPLNDEQQRQARMIQDSGRSLLALVNDLLDLGKLESQQPGFHLAPTDIDALVEASAERLRPLAETRGIDLRIRLSGVGAATVDRRRVDQAVTNLVGNAIKFTTQGYVLVATVDEGDWVAIEVADTGPGIDPQVLPHLFDEFVSSVDTMHPGGTGLGLAISREIANRHGGKITASTREGKGSRFVLTLPRVPHCDVPRPDTA